MESKHFFGNLSRNDLQKDVDIELLHTKRLIEHSLVWFVCCIFTHRQKLTEM